MKKLMLLSPLLLAACAPAATGPTTYTRDAFVLSASSNGKDLQVQPTPAGWHIVQPNYDLIVDFAAAEDGFHFGRTPTQGFSILLHNTGKTAIKVNWDETTVSLRGNSSGVIPEGVKYIDAERSKPALIVPPGVTSAKELMPASSVSWTGKGWYVSPLFPNNIGKSNVTLYLTLEGETKEGLTFNFTKK